MKEQFKKIRHEYEQKELNSSDLLNSPFDLFAEWFQNAIDQKIPDANAMTVATVSKEGKPSARILLLKDVDEKGFCFFTNYESNKARQIDENPHAALVFFWPELEQQIRIEGKIEKLEAEKSDQYFYERPIGSRIAAIISPQSKEIDNRNQLESDLHLFLKEEESEISRPNYWGGYRLIPTLFEFWQGRENRLNDRFEYFLENNTWHTKRLAP